MESYFEKEKEKPSLRRQIMRFGSHVYILVWKTALIFYRNKLSTLIQIACPLFVCIYLSYIQNLGDNFAARLMDPDPPVQKPSIPKCWGANCVSLRVGLTGPPTNWTDFAISHIAQNSRFVIGKDIKVHQEDPLEFIENINRHQNVTQVALILCTDELTLPENPYITRIPCTSSVGSSYFYSILYNFTGVSRAAFDSNAPDPLNKVAIATKLAIDNAILAYEKPGASIEATVQAYPKPKNRFMKNFDIISSNGPLYFFIPPMILFGTIVSEIVKEKEQRLRYGLLVMGVSNFEFWLSWFIISFIMVFMSTHVQIISGMLFGFDFFLKTPYLVLLLIFQLFGMSMVMLGFVVSACLSSAKSAYTGSYSFFLVGLVFQLFFSSSTLISTLHITSLPDWAVWIRKVLSLYPPFTFAKILNDISVKSAYHINLSDRLWEAGPGYTWDDFFNYRRGLLRGNSYIIPSTWDSVSLIMTVTIIFVLFAWYCDHVFPQNRGKRYPYLFFLRRDYWFYRHKVHLDKETDGLYLDGISKNYYAGGKVIKAVKPLHISIERNQLFALIGHNGAGKTTLLSMLTGLLSPTDGTAYLCGFDVVHESNLISKIIGYCPQYNILWDELTAKEHVYMFSKLKFLPDSVIDLETQALLTRIELDGNSLVQTFSGGMKRRLSVGIATIGNPSIIFLDEPTTGMDPISKKFVWSLIKDMKNGNVVVLTTHSMEEADILADKVAVMVDGEFKSVGTSLYLKNHYGEGYKIDLVSHDPHLLWKNIDARFSHVHLIDLSGGSLVVSLPRTFTQEMEEFMKALENKEFGELIEDWALTNSSLEEVFMRLTDKKNN